MSSDPQAVEDLYTKIALDNKLVTRFQVRKAAEELDTLAKDGQSLSLGEAMVRLGFLSERQHQSVVNACRYREQRDFDKRFGRQCLRMELLTQDHIEGALEVQKDAYQGKGNVRALSEILVEQGRITQKQVDDVKRGIDERDRAKARSGKSPALNQSGPTPLAASSGARKDVGGAAAAAAAPAKKSGTGDDDDDDDLAGIDLDDEDLDVDDKDLADVDLDEDDLDEDDLQGIDLDEDLGGDDEDGEDAAKRSPSRPGEDEKDGPSQEGALEIDPKKLADLVERPGDDGGEDEADLAEDVSEIGSDVELDEEDVKALETMDSGDETEEGAWAAEAFDDRPLTKRPSERLKTASPSSERRAVAAAPSTPPAQPAASARQKPTPPVAPTKPVAPRAPAPRPAAKKADDLMATHSSPFESGTGAIGAPPPPPPAKFPGGEVLDELSGSESGAEVVVPPAAERSSEEKPMTASEVGRLLDAESKKSPAQAAPSSEEAALRERLAQSARRLEEPTKGGASGRSRPALDLDDPRIKRAFDKAMEVAWRAFQDELQAPSRPSEDR